MIRNFKHVVAGATMMLAVFSPAHAAPVTLYFTGTLFNVHSLNGASPLGAIANGDAIKGSVSFDTQLAQYHVTDNLTFRQDYSYNRYVSLYLTDLNTGGSTNNIGRTFHDFSSTLIQRNNSASNSFEPWHVEAYNYSAGRYVDYVSSFWNASDISGLLSTLFVDPAGGISFAQPINLSDATQGGFIQELSTSSTGVLYNNTANFSLTYIGVQPVPLPAAGWLLFSGLLGLAGTGSAPGLARKIRMSITNK